VLEMKGVLKLIFVLPGDCALEKRLQAVDIMQRYFAGDLSLIEEIEANAKSDNHIAQMFRASMGSGGAVVENEEDRSKKRQRFLEDLEDYNLQLHNEGLVIMNRHRSHDADKAAAEARSAAAKAELDAAEARRVVEENLLMAAETERIKNENEEIANVKQRHENTRMIKKIKLLKWDLPEIYQKFMSGVLNSKSYMLHTIRYNLMTLRSDGDQDILNMEKGAFLKYFREFLEVNSCRTPKAVEAATFKKMLHCIFPGIISEGKVSGANCYQINYDMLREYFADGKNGYDAEIVF